MDILTFVTTVVVVTASGALAPGPLLFANVTYGTRSGARSGLAFSIAHSVVEFSLVVLLAQGVLAITSDPIMGPRVQGIIEVVGGTAIMVFGILQIREFLPAESRASTKGSKSSRNPLLVGFAFTVLNPYFLVWWLTNGPFLISVSMAFASWAGLVLMYVAHVWMDYAWLTITAHFARRGTNLAGSRTYRVVMILFGVIIILFGAALVSFNVVRWVLNLK